MFIYFLILYLTSDKYCSIFYNMLIELIRKQILECGKSRYEISQDTGVEQAALCRIMKGGSCKAETVDKLLEYFGYEIKRKEGKTRKVGDK